MTNRDKKGLDRLKTFLRNYFETNKAYAYTLADVQDHAASYFAFIPEIKRQRALNLKHYVPICLRSPILLWR